MRRQLSLKRTAARLLSLSAATWLAAVPLHAQDPVPRTRTFSGLVAPAFPYARPEEVGLSREKLNRLGENIVTTRPQTLTVSAARATAVKEALVSQHGVDPARLASRGVRPFSPVSTNSNDAGRALERRAEIVQRLGFLAGRR